MSVLSDPVRIYLERRRQMEQDRWEREKWRAEQERLNKLYELERQRQAESVRQWQAAHELALKEHEARQQQQQQEAAERALSLQAAGYARPGIAVSTIGVPVAGDVSSPATYIPAEAYDESGAVRKDYTPFVPLTPSTPSPALSAALTSTFTSRVPGGVTIGDQYLIPTTPEERAEAAAERELKIEEKKEAKRYELLSKRIGENIDLLPESMRGVVKASLLLGTPIKLDWNELRTWAQERLYDPSITENERKRMRELLRSMMEWEVGVRSAVSVGNPLNALTMNAYRRAAEILKKVNDDFVSLTGRAPTQEEIREVITQYTASSPQVAAEDSRALELLQRFIVQPPKDIKTPADTIRELYGLAKQLESGAFNAPNPLSSVVPTPPVPRGGPVAPAEGPIKLELDQYIKRR